MPLSTLLPPPPQKKKKKGGDQKMVFLEWLVFVWAVQEDPVQLHEGAESALWSVQDCENVFMIFVGG